MNNCEHCGATFEPVHHKGEPRRFCSEGCRKKAEKNRGKLKLRKWKDAKRKEATGLEWHEEKCKECGKVFPKYNDPENRQGWRTYCSDPCKKAQANRMRVPVGESDRDCVECGRTFTAKGKQRKLCSEKCARNRRENKRFRNHPISREDFIKMKEKQDGRCQICKKESFLVIDHCHTEGHVRGLLCSQCNSGLGMFRDSVESLSAAIEYLS